MLLNFIDNSSYEKPAGSRLVGIQKNGRRPVSVTLDYYDLEKILKSDKKDQYLVHVWAALAPDKRINYTKENNNNED